jgi:hypothetical protein
MAPISFSILNFLKTGYVGPLCLSLTRAEVIAILGTPSRRFFSRERHEPEYSLKWKYGLLLLAFPFDDMLTKIALYPARAGRKINFPETIDLKGGYPTREVSIAGFERYLKYHGISYFISKSPYWPRYRIFSVENSIDVYFRMSRLESISISLE